MEPRLILEVSGLDSLDVAGVGVLADLLLRVRAHGGRMALAGVRDSVRRVLRRDEVAGLIPVYASVADALFGLGRAEEPKAGGRAGKRLRRLKAGLRSNGGRRAPGRARGQFSPGDRLRPKVSLRRVRRR